MIVIVVGDGEDPERIAQAKFFIESAVTIAAYCLGTPVEICIPDVRKTLPTGSLPDNTSVHHYSNARDLVNKIFSEKGSSDTPLCLIAIGHGGQVVSDHGVMGSVELCTGAKPEDRQIDTKDVNKIKPKVYIGLHCFAANFTGMLEPGIIHFSLTGEEKGTHDRIVRFTDCKTSIGEFMSGLLLTEASKKELMVTLREIADSSAQYPNKAVGAK